MRAVDSKYRQFPWAFTYPTREDGKSTPDLIGEINQWFLEHDLRYNRDYIYFEVSELTKSFGGLVKRDEITMVAAFKDRNKALLFKMSWA